MPRGSRKGYRGKGNRKTRDSYHEPREMQQSAQVHVGRQEQKLVSRVKFLDLTEVVIKSVDRYGRACSNGKSPETLEVINDGVNLQMRILKTRVESAKESGRPYDLETIKLARGMANEFKDRVMAAKRQQGQTKRAREAIKRMEFYAGVIDQILEDPESVADPREVKYTGPSGEELDRRTRAKLKRGEQLRNGMSSLMAAQHKVDDLVRDVRDNPEKYQREHERMFKENERRPPSKRDPRGYVPADDFIFDVGRENLESESHDMAPPNIQDGFYSHGMDPDSPMEDARRW